MHSLSRGSQTLQEPLVSRLAIQYTPQLLTALDFRHAFSLFGYGMRTACRRAL